MIEPTLTPRERFAGGYAAALREFVGGAGEVALLHAYELGRVAALEGLGVIEIAELHHEALAGLTASANGGASHLIAQAGQLLGEALSTHEMNLRSYRASARLLGLDQNLAEKNAELDRAREQLTTILDATTAVIYLKGADGRYLFVNRAFQEIFGLRREEVIGRADEEILPGPAAEVLRLSDGRVLAERTPRELEETVPERDGPHTFLSLKFPLVDDGGCAYGICCVATDITERKQRDEQLRRAVEAAEAANSELESFSYSVAHDLRAPLRSIDGFGQALLEDFADRLDAQGKKYLSYMRDSAQHMAHLIDDLLTLSRVSRGELRRGPVDLSAIVETIAERLRATEPGRRVEIDVQPSVRGEGDARLLRAVLENLLGNAWKFTGKREVARIEFGADLSARPVVYRVRDNGAGFDMAYKSKLFGVFQRLHSASEFEGTGIGLATVQRIIGRHGGRVWAEGELDRGATIYFTLGAEAQE